MLKGRMVVSGGINDAIQAHEKAFPDEQATHIAVERSRIDTFTVLCNLGLIKSGDVELELTHEINPPAKHMWVGHDN